MPCGPNNALWLSLVGLYLVQREEFEEGMPMVTRSIELNPNPPRWIRMGAYYENYRKGRYEEALDDAKTIELDDDFRGELFVAATYGQLGRVDEARPALEEFRRKAELLCRKAGQDELDLDVIRQELIVRHALTPALADHLLEGLRKAGL